MFRTDRAESSDGSAVVLTADMNSPRFLDPGPQRLAICPIDSYFFRCGGVMRAIRSLKRRA